MGTGESHDSGTLAPRRRRAWLGDDGTIVAYSPNGASIAYNPDAQGKSSEDRWELLKMTKEMQLSRDERALLCRLMGEVLAGRAFLSVGEMSTITGWTQVEVLRLNDALASGLYALSVDECRFLGHALYAYGDSVRHGHAITSPREVSDLDQFDERLGSCVKRHVKVQAGGDVDLPAKTLGGEP